MTKQDELTCQLPYDVTVGGTTFRKGVAVELPGEQWVPSNGTEGSAIIESFCSYCERDKVMNGEATDEDADKDPSLYCQILSDSFLGPVKEWREVDDEVRCIAFVAKGEALPDRCPYTMELPL